MIEYGSGNLRIPKLTRPVYVVAAGTTDFRRFYPEKQTIELVVEAFKMAVIDGLGMTPREFKQFPNFGIYSHFADHLSDQLLEAAKLHGELGLNPLGNLEIKTGGATGGSSVLAGIMAIASGIASVCPVIGWERMDEVGTNQGNTYIANAADKDFETPLAERYSTYYDLTSRRYAHDNKPPRLSLAKIAAKDHYYAQFSPYAQQPGNFEPERILKLKAVSGELTPPECCAMSTGASCLILADEEVAFRFTDKPVLVKGIGSGSDTLRTADRRGHMPILLPNETPALYRDIAERYPDFTNFEAAHWAAYHAYNSAGIVNPIKELDVLETHTAFTISDLQTWEDIGLAPPGRGYEFIENGDAFFEGRLPTNLSGGLLGGMHSVGATGIWQLLHIFWQIRGEWEKFLGEENYWRRYGKTKPANWRNLQVKNARRGMGISHAGTGSHVTCIIFERGW